MYIKYTITSGYNLYTGPILDKRKKEIAMSWYKLP